ncbi:MAG: hypothetical protein ABIA63_01835 [bacterium]
MKNICAFSLSVLLLIITIFSEEAMIQPRRLIDCPTAGILPRAYYDLDIKLYDGGGIIAGSEIGVTNRLNLGISYGAQGLIGRSAVKGYPWPGAFIKYRIMEESYHLPAIALGFQSQGHGNYSQNRFQFKSKGIFIAVSKNYLIFGQPLGLHQGFNYSLMDNQLETHSSGLDTLDSKIKDRNNFLNIYLGLDKSINNELALVMEYDCAMDDNLTQNPFKGYLNAGVRYKFDKSFYIELDFKDLLQQKRLFSGVNDNKPEYERMKISRELRIVFLKSF